MMMLRTGKSGVALLLPTCVSTCIDEVHLNIETRKMFAKEIDPSSQGRSSDSRTVFLSLKTALLMLALGRAWPACLTAPLQHIPKQSLLDDTTHAHTHTTISPPILRWGLMEKKDPHSADDPHTSICKESFPSLETNCVICSQMNVNNCFFIFLKSINRQSLVDKDSYRRKWSIINLNNVKLRAGAEMEGSARVLFTFHLVSNQEILYKWDEK